MSFDGLVAVDDLCFSAEQGQITALIGPNGAGKTTVFNCLTGFYKPTIGAMSLNSEGHYFALERMDGYRIARHAKVARTFQNIRLFPQMTVLENLLVAQHNRLMHASMYSIAGLFGLRRYRSAQKQAIELACHWLAQTGLIDMADEEAAQLPYGAQRRLEIARAMCIDPVLLCLDEPAAGLNPKESAELNEMLLSIRDQERIGILLIEHDMSVVMEISDQVVVLDYGSRIALGPPDQVRNDPKVIRAYLGEVESE